MPRHRTQEFRKFLDDVERNVPADLDVHIVMDNYGTHKTKLICNWFAKRPRWHVHYLPTSASWINQVERFFARLTDRAIRRGVFRSVVHLEVAITAYINAINANPKPFRWTKSADDILASIQSFCLRSLAAHAWNAKDFRIRTLATSCARSFCQTPDCWITTGSVGHSDPAAWPQVHPRPASPRDHSR